MSGCVCVYVYVCVSMSVYESIVSTKPEWAMRQLVLWGLPSWGRRRSPTCRKEREKERETERDRVKDRERQGEKERDRDK